MARSSFHARGSRRPTAGCLATALLITVSCVTAQSPGIAGTVAQPSGPGVSGVLITSLPSFGGIARRTTSENHGAYSFAELDEGTYRLDFDLAGFDLIRRNHVRVRRGKTVTVDATVSISSVCECVEFVPATPLRERAGQVVDPSGWPLPHARLELVSPTRREVASADDEGRFQVRLPLNGAWPLTASDSGFRAVTQRVSGDGTPIPFSLRPDDGAEVPATERFPRGCRCLGDLFTHQGR